MHEFIMDEREEKQLKAELIFAKKLGLIEEAGPEGNRNRWR